MNNDENRFMKRFFDLAIAVPSLIILSSLLIFIGILVRMKIGSPVLFRQLRPGLYGKPFTIYKFRTMTDTRDENKNLLPDGERLTRLGRFLRKTSMDELPELFNVIKGDMSIVGPRPLLMQYLDRYTPEQARRHEVKPGITGWAQVNGRNAIMWEDKFKLDVWYVDNWSLWLDVRIVLMTVMKVLKREGISQKGEATMEEFMNDRFKDWEYPEIEEGKLTKYNWVVQHKSNLSLGFQTDIGAFTYINAKNGVVIEDLVQIGSHCSIYSVSTIDGKEGKIVLKKNCRIGSHSVIMPGVTVGENAVIGAMSFVNRDIPDDCVAVGVPAKVIKKSNPQIDSNSLVD
ncbi:MAG: sugar transferase [Deltaproteobacteria bacterium]|nr:sugar transferase [Deltaproteobacteria bacterium]